MTRTVTEDRGRGHSGNTRFGWSVSSLESQEDNAERNASPLIVELVAKLAIRSHEINDAFRPCIASDRHPVAEDDPFLNWAAE